MHNTRIFQAFFLAMALMQCSCGKDEGDPPSSTEDMYTPTVDMSSVDLNQPDAEGMDMMEAIDMFMPVDMVVTCPVDGKDPLSVGETTCVDNKLYTCAEDGMLMDKMEACGEFPVDIRVKLRVEVTDKYTGIYSIHPFIEVSNVGISEATGFVDCLLEFYENNKKTDTINDRSGNMIAPAKSVESRLQFTRGMPNPKKKIRAVYTCSTPNEPDAAATLGNSAEFSFEY